MNKKRLFVQARLSKLARKLLEKQKKIASLTSAGKWGYLTQKLLERSNNQSELRILKHWKILVKKACYQGHFALRGVDDMKMDKVINGLHSKNTKMHSMEIIGRWGNLYRKLLKNMNVSRIGVHGRWLRFTNGLLTRHYKKRSMLNMTKWNFLARKIVQRDNMFKSMANYQRWGKLVKKLAAEGHFRLGYIAANSVKDMSSKLNTHHQKVSEMKTLGKWGRLIKKLQANARA